MDIITKNSKRPFYRIDSEMAAVLIELGLVDPLRPAPQQPAFPAKGWVVQSMLVAGADQAGARESVASTTKFVIVFHDGFGGKQVYTGPPGPRRVWDGTKQDYVIKESDCPDDVVQQWRAVNGLPTENERKARVAEADQRRRVEDFQRSQPNPYGVFRD